MRILLAGTLAVQSRAAARTGGARRVHDHIGAALVGDRDYKLVSEAERRRLLHVFVVLIKICQGLSTSNTFYRHGNDDAVTRNAQMQPAPLVGDELLCFIAVGNGQDDALFVRLDAEKIHHALHGRAAPVHDNRHRQL
ncbi:unknown [Firmicutes bacterium CAG:240]|nr:unknown [Firmicutes bacterium CAG:240]